MTKLEELIELAAAYERAPYPAPGSAAVAHAAVEALAELRVLAAERRRLREKRLTVDEAIAQLGGES
jgi:hypothetical protein